jgi:hypothetical protein
VGVPVYMLVEAATDSFHVVTYFSQNFQRLPVLFGVPLVEAMQEPHDRPADEGYGDGNKYRFHAIILRRRGWRSSSLRLLRRVR